MARHAFECINFEPLTAGMWRHCSAWGGALHRQRGGLHRRDRAFDLISSEAIVYELSVSYLFGARRTERCSGNHWMKKTSVSLKLMLGGRRACFEGQVTMNLWPQSTLMRGRTGLVCLDEAFR